MTKEEIWKVSGINSDILVSNMGRIATIKKGSNNILFEGSRYNTQRLMADAFPELFFTDNRSDFVSLDGEEWRPIPDAEGYEISNKGRVRHLIKTIRSMYYALIKPVLCGAKHRKYMRIIINTGKIHHDYYIGRLVYSVFVGDVPERCKIEYIDGDISNNSLENLRLVLYDDFFDKMKKNCKTQREERRKTITDKAHAMMEMRKEGKTYREIADVFGVGLTTACKYITGICNSKY